MFVYLVTREVPAEFRLFLLRYADVLKAVNVRRCPRDRIKPTFEDRHATR